MSGIEIMHMDGRGVKENKVWMIRDWFINN
jgi:hypothetical protein